MHRCLVVGGALLLVSYRAAKFLLALLVEEPDLCFELAEPVVQVPVLGSGIDGTAPITVMLLIKRAEGAAEETGRPGRRLEVHERVRARQLRVMDEWYGGDDALLTPERAASLRVAWAAAAAKRSAPRSSRAATRRQHRDRLPAWPPASSS